MQQLSVNPNLCVAEQLEQLADQAGGTYCTNVLVCRMTVGGSLLHVTLVNQGSPGGTQEWTVVNGSESAPASFATGSGGFWTYAGSTEYSHTAESYARHLLAQGTWHGASLPYYPD